MNKRRPPTPPPPPPRKKTWWLFAGVGALVVIALAIAVWSSSGNDKVTQGSGGTAAETQPVTVVGTPLPPPPESGADTAIGLPAPTLKGYTFDGSPIDITPGGGRAKMVVFLAHWCPHCNREIPVILRWAATGGVPANLDIVAVSTAVSAQRDNYPPSKWIVDKQWTYPVMADNSNNDAAGAYGVTGFPSFTIVGPDGTVKLRSSGELAETQLDGLVASALAG